MIPSPAARLWRSTRVDVLSSFVLTLCLFGCVHHPAHPAVAAARPDDNSYMDLRPDTNVRIVVPVNRAGGPEPDDASNPQTSGNTITLSAPGLIGYNISHYAIDKRRSGKVRLRFTNATLTRGGMTVTQTNAPPLPFSLPENSRYIRLIYLTRSSQADHNMAIVAATNRQTLSAFTEEVKRDPTACRSTPVLTCIWVPTGIAVRVE